MTAIASDEQSEWRSCVGGEYHPVQKHIPNKETTLWLWLLYWGRGRLVLALPRWGGALGNLCRLSVRTSATHGNMRIKLNDDGIAFFDRKRNLPRGWAYNDCGPVDVNPRCVHFVMWFTLSTFPSIIHPNTPEWVHRMVCVTYCPRWQAPRVPISATPRCPCWSNLSSGKTTDRLWMFTACCDTRGRAKHSEAGTSTTRIFCGHTSPQSIRRDREWTFRTRAT